MIYPNKITTGIRSKHRKLSQIASIKMNLINRKIVYCKGCGNYSIYERANGVRGMRFQNKTYDMIPYLRDMDGGKLIDIGNIMFMPELYNFLMKSAVVC